MFKSIALVSTVVAAAYAQSSNPLIPSGVSDGCRTFLNSLNDNAEVASCSAALNNALDAFAPGKASASADAVTTALGEICASSMATACPTNAITSQITAFSAACANELTSNKDVISIYDSLFLITPLQKALCTKNDAGDYCATSGPAISGSPSTIASSLYTQSGQTVIPNGNAFASNHIPFLLISPTLEKDQLCTPCTRNVLSAYISFESSFPYGPGLSNSQFIPNQGELYEAVVEKCGAKFMDNEVKAAGGLGTNSIFGSDDSAAPAISANLVSAAAAGLTLVAALAL